MHLVSCTNTHHDVTDFVDLGMVKNTKSWISWEQNIIKKSIIKKSLTCTLDDTSWEDIVSEVTFTIFTSFQWLLDVTVKDVLDFFACFLLFTLLNWW